MTAPDCGSPPLVAPENKTGGSLPEGAGPTAALAALLCLIGCQLLGELIREAAHLPIPGPVIGLFLLAGALARGRQGRIDVPPALDRTAAGLISVMGLLFVPAGVGIIAEGDLLRKEWLPILAALLGSTFLSIAVTGAVMHRETRHE